MSIRITSLHKAFGHTQALDGLDLHVATGEVHGFLGPNGSGKTTTIRILLGLLRADAGVVKLLGGDPWRDAASLHHRLAYVPGEVNLWPNLTGGEIIDMLGRLRGGLAPARRAMLVEKFELDPTRKAHTYSRGNRQKVALIAALASNVELLIFDEPTSGLDPLMQAVFDGCVDEERQIGRTVLLASHVLSEVEKLCDRVSIIRAGRTVDSGTLSELRHFTRTSIQADLLTPPNGHLRLPGVHDLHVDGTRIWLSVDSDKLTTVLAQLTGLGVQTLISRPPTLDELFLRHYRADDDAPTPQPVAS